ncbi:MAG: HDOD domain-containing protein, partial [Opitutales bacterium]
DAISMLGINEIYRIVNLVSSGEYLEEKPASMDIHKGSLWRHSLAVALIMDIIAAELTDLEGLPCTLGLLHHIGKLALHQRCGNRYAKIFHKVETELIAVNAAEAASLGFNHAEAGAKMLEQWGFSEEVYLPIHYQYDPHSAGKFKELAGALQIANWGASAIECNDGRDAWALEMNPDVFHIEETKLEQAVLEGRFRLEKALKSLEPRVN